MSDSPFTSQDSGLPVEKEPSSNDPSEDNPSDLPMEEAEGLESDNISQDEGMEELQLPVYDEEGSNYTSEDNTLDTCSEDEPDDNGISSMYEIHQPRIDAEYQEKYSRSPTVREFWDSYLTSYIEPAGWVGRWEIMKWEDNEWPVTTNLKKIIAPIQFDINSLFFRCVEIEDGTNLNEFSLADIEGKEAELQIPAWEIIPFCEVKGSAINFQTFKEAMRLYRYYKDYLCLPLEETLPAQQWFDYGKQRMEEFVYDLDTPGALNNNIRQTMINLFFQLRTKERQAVFADQNSQMEDMENAEQSNANEVLLKMDLDLIGHRFKYYTEPTIRRALETVENESRLEAIKQIENSLFVVISPNKTINFSLLSKIKDAFGSLPELKDLNVEDLDFRIEDDLQSALFKCKPGTVVIIAPGNYELSSLGNLEQGGCLIGIPNKDQKVCLTTYDTGEIWFLLQGGQTFSSITFANIEFLVRRGFSEQRIKTLFSLQKGKFMFNNCLLKVEGLEEKTSFPGETYSITAFELRTGAKLYITKSRIENFCNVISGNSYEDIGVSISIKETCVSNAHIFYQIDGTNVQLEIEDIQLEKVNIVFNGDLITFSSHVREYLKTNLKITRKNGQKLQSIEKLTLPSFLITN